MAKVLNELKINIFLACTGGKIGNIIVDKNIKINECFNNFIGNKYSVELKESDIKIMIDSILIYSYYDQSIGNVLFNKKDLFLTNKDILEMHEIIEIK